MNKSYSKIRHIQEANKMLEKRLLIEVEDNDMSGDSPSPEELKIITVDPQKDLYRTLGRDLVELYMVSKKSPEFVKYVTENGYKRLPKRVNKIYEESRGRLSAYDDNQLVWLGKKYWKDMGLRNKVEELKKTN
jgi:hypothetical protein